MTETGWFLGAPPRIKVPGLEGWYVHLGSDVQKTVVFLGFADPSSPGGIRCEGTGFFLLYDATGYLVTARHVADNLESTPFVVRINRTEGPAALLAIDAAQWYTHADKTVDVAVLPLELRSKSGFEAQYISEKILLTSERLRNEKIDVGDLCYTVGLFRFIYGKQRNFPLVHSGNIALLPPKGERIPVWNKRTKKTENVEGYLIESRAIDGASGSPVFARASYRLESMDFTDENGQQCSPLISDGRVSLLGVYQGAWFLPPDAALAETAKAKSGDVVSVGVGVVVPASKIIEILEGQPLRDKRKTKPPAGARQLSVSEPQEPPTSTENPSGKEDFNSLLNAAARKRPQAD